jgi:hypothetical protein
MGTLKEPNGILAKYQDVKTPIVRQEREKRLEAEMPSNDDLLLQGAWHTVETKHGRRAKDGQSILWMLPELSIHQQSVQWFEQALHL